MSRNPYVRVVSPTRWYFRQGRYMRYMAREVTCLFVGAYTALLVLGLCRLAQGETAWNSFLTLLATPSMLVFQVVTLAFAIYHSATWFNLTPKAMPVQLGERFLPGGIIIGVHYAAWGVASLVVLCLAGAF